MQNIISKLKHNFTVTKPDLIDLLVLLFFAGFGWLVVDLWSKPRDIINIITILCIIYYMIRTLYERVYNRTNIPTLETPAAMVQAMADILKKDFDDKKPPAYHVVDFGSGDGQLTRKIANTIPQADVLGIENAKFPYSQSMFFKKLFKIKNVNYQRTDFYEYDCRNIDAVVMYLSVQASQKLGEKLYNELKSGAVVLSNEFELKGQWPKPETLERFTPFKTTLYIYRK